MLIDFNELDEHVFENMNNGTGQVRAKIFLKPSCMLIVSRIKPNSSIGLHRQKSGDDINFVVSGNGIAFCDGKEEILSPGVCHLCPKNSRHMIKNTGPQDLVLYTVVHNG